MNARGTIANTTNVRHIEWDMHKFPPDGLRDPRHRPLASILWTLQLTSTILMYPPLGAKRVSLAHDRSALYLPDPTTCPSVFRVNDHFRVQLESCVTQETPLVRPSCILRGAKALMSRSSTLLQRLELPQHAFISATLPLRSTSSIKCPSS